MPTAPTIAADVKAGLRVTRRAYVGTDKDLTDTLRDIAAKIREGGRTPSIRSMAGLALKEAGFPQGVQNQAEALRNFVRSKAGYQPDPPMVEFVQSAPVTLCAEGAPICISIGDCDDMCVALGSLFMAAGLDTQCLIQDYGGDRQQHILLAIKDEGGAFLTCDPSALSKPIGYKDTAVSEFWMDPLNPQALKINAPQGEFVGVGRPKSLGLPPDPCLRGRCFAPRVAMASMRTLKKPCCSACAQGKPCTGCGSKVHPCPCETGRKTLGATTGNSNVLNFVPGMEIGSIIGGVGGGMAGYHLAKSATRSTGWRIAGAVAGFLLGANVGAAIGASVTG